MNENNYSFYPLYNLLNDYLWILMKILLLWLREQQILKLFYIGHIKLNIQIK